MCLSIACGGDRCAGHTRPVLEERLGSYIGAYPDGPEPCALVAEEQRIGMLHGHVELADRWLRTAQTEDERVLARAYRAAARARLEGIWAAKAAGAGVGAAALTDEDRARFDDAVHAAERADGQAERHELMSDTAMWDGDGSRAAIHATMAAHHRTAAAEARQEQARILADARARRSARAPAPVAVELTAEQKTRIATYSQWNRPDDLVTGGQAAMLVGEEAAGQLPVALEADRNGRYPNMHRFGDVAGLAGEDLPEPKSTQRTVWAHTAWRRSGEAQQIAAWRELEARRNRERLGSASTWSGSDYDTSGYHKGTGRDRQGYDREGRDANGRTRVQNLDAETLREYRSLGTRIRQEQQAAQQWATVLAGDPARAAAFTASSEREIADLRAEQQGLVDDSEARRSVARGEYAASAATFEAMLRAS